MFFCCGAAELRLTGRREQLWPRGGGTGEMRLAEGRKGSGSSAASATAAGARPRRRAGCAPPRPSLPRLALPCPSRACGGAAAALGQPRRFSGNALQPRRCPPLPRPYVPARPGRVGGSRRTGGAVPSRGGSVGGGRAGGTETEEGRERGKGGGRREAGRSTAPNPGRPSRPCLHGRARSRAPPSLWPSGKHSSESLSGFELRKWLLPSVIGEEGSSLLWLCSIKVIVCCQLKMFGRVILQALTGVCAGSPAR